MNPFRETNGGSILWQAAHPLIVFRIATLQDPVSKRKAEKTVEEQKKEP